jgi:acyl dehydratase
MAEPRYLEDFSIGEQFETGSHLVNLADAVAFAEQHDPQGFHTDEEAARAHPVFRGLSTSGYYTLLVTHRLIFERDIGHAWGLIGKGIDSLRWTQPVRPGDRLRVVGEVVSTERHPAQRFGTLRVRIETRNQGDEAVLTMIVNTIVPSRVALEPFTRAAA